MEVINCFNGAYSWLSNYFVFPITMSDGITYTSVESAFQAQKTLDIQKRNKIACLSPSASKKEGRLVDLRPDWNEIKDGVMLEALRLKFMDAALRQLLINTGDAKLIEGNWWHDCYWGECNCNKCGSHGKNMLGQLLMKVRNEIQEGSK